MNFLDDIRDSIPKDIDDPHLYKMNTIESIKKGQKFLFDNSKTSKHGLVKTTLYIFMISTGISKSELLALNEGSVMFDGKRIRDNIVIERVNHNIYLNSILKSYIKMYLNISRENFKPSNPLFISERGERYSKNSLDRMIESLKEYNLDMGYTPTVLQQSFNYWMCELHRHDAISKSLTKTIKGSNYFNIRNQSPPNKNPFLIKRYYEDLSRLFIPLSDIKSTNINELVKLE